MPGKTMQHLVLDLGNSSLKAAIAEGGVVVRRLETMWLPREWRPPLPAENLAALVSTGAELVALSTTRRESTAQVRAHLEDSFASVVVAGEDLTVPMPTCYLDPAECGTDRLLAAHAAYARVGGACAVADAGTALTIDGVDAGGRFLGGIIMPGLSSSYRALAAGTSLPELHAQELLTDPEEVFGRSTAASLRGGFARLCEGAARAAAAAVASVGDGAPLFVCGHDAPFLEAAVARLQLDLRSMRAGGLVLEGLARSVEASAPVDRSSV